MANLTIVPADVRIVRMVEMLPDGPANEALAAGEAVRIDGTTGKYTPGNGTAAGEAGVKGIACNTADFAEQTITVMRKGILDLGEALVGLNFGDPIYLSDTDGTLATTVGTVTVLVGFIVPGWGATAADRLLAVGL